MSGAGGNLRVEVRARGRSAQGLVYDLGPEGCLLGGGEGLIIAGTPVALRFASGVRVNGRAMLLHGSVARIEFEQRLHEAVLAHLHASDPRQSAGVFSPPAFGAQAGRRLV